MQGQALIIKGSRWKIGDERHVCIWQDKWLTSTPNSLFHSTCSIPDNVTTVARYIISVSDRSWNLGAIRNLFPPVESAAIESMILDDLSFSDRLIWSWSLNGDYFVKSGYAFCHAIALGNQTLFTNNVGQSLCMDPTFWKLNWEMDTLPKIKFFFLEDC